jgi:hypothetical protein
MSIFDEQFIELKKSYPNTEARNDGTGAMNITVPNLDLPDGWSKRQANLYFKVPVGYPVSRPDCFWVDPDIRLANGNMPKNSNMQPLPPEQTPKLWFSWHAEQWQPSRDSLKTYIQIMLNRLKVPE